MMIIDNKSVPNNKNIPWTSSGSDGSPTGERRNRSKHCSSITLHPSHYIGGTICFRMESFHWKPNRNIRTRENSSKVATKNILVSFGNIPNIVCFFDWSSIIFHKKFFLHICEDVTNVMRKVDNKVEWFPKFCQT